MRTFATYIEYLLMTRHYCYVPGRGAYMLSDEPATMGTHPNIGTDSRRLHTLEAPRRVIRFSPLHHHDDGMLANLLMEAEGMSFDEACRYIERQVALLPEDFHTSSSLHIDTENFGCNELSIETWGDIEARLNALAHPEQQDKLSEEKKAKDADIIAIPRYWAQRIAAVLLIAVCFFASFLGLDDQSTQQQYANVLDLSMLQRGSVINSSWDEADDADYEDENSLSAGDELGDIYAYGSSEDDIWSDEEVAAFALTEEEPAEEEATTVETVAAEAPKPEPAKIAEPKAESVAPAKVNPIKPQGTINVAPNGKLYYIIVASCPNQQDANRALINMQKKGYSEIGILERDDRFRLYINRFGDKAEAEAYLKVLRQDDSFRSAWLLPVREASLSSIIKNTYDDNQLFMELSHLNKRTERDQG